MTDFRTRPALLFALALLPLAARAETVWLEAEDARDTNMPKVADNPATISGGQWLEARSATASTPSTRSR